jgi:glycosyltransferase involved in cell wall biosynthesis
MTPTVSVVIPLYNKAAYIERAVRSVLVQTFQDFEILVIDDGSRDGGAELVQTFKDSRIHLIQQENAGVSAARNKGIMESRGDLIAFLDADDAWEQEFLEIILRLSNKYPEAGLYCTAYNIVLPDGRKRKAKIKAIPSSPWEGILPNYFRAAALGDPPVCASALCIPRHIFDTAGMFPVGETSGEDVDMWFRVALKYPVAFSRAIGAIYHREAANRACNSNDAKVEEVPFIKRAHEAIDSGEVPMNMVSDLLEYITKKQLDIVRRKVLQGDYREAKKLLKNSKTSLTSTRRKKVFWCFWMMMPIGLTRLSFQIKWLILRKYSKLME